MTYETMEVAIKDLRPGDFSAIYGTVLTVSPERSLLANRPGSPDYKREPMWVRFDDPDSGRVTYSRRRESDQWGLGAYRWEGSKTMTVERPDKRLLPTTPTRFTIGLWSADPRWLNGSLALMPGGAS